MPGLVLTAVGTVLQKRDDKEGSNKMTSATEAMGDTNGDILGWEWGQGTLERAALRRGLLEVESSK